MSKNLTVSCANVDEKDLLLLEFLLTLVERQTGSECTMSQDMNGDLVIIDVDQSKGVALYNQLKSQTSGQILITLSEKNDATDSEYKLAKPLRSAEVVSLTQQILKKHAATLLGDSSAGATAGTASQVQPNQGMNFRTSQCKRLFNYLTAKPSAKYVEISLQALTLYVDFESQQFLCPNKLISLSMLFKADLNKLSIREMNTAEYLGLKQQIEARKLNELIIFSALLGSSSELTAEVSPAEKLGLSRWPGSLERLPKHLSRSVFAIAAYMTRSRSTVSEIAVETQASPDVVIGFINACAVLGYLNSGPDQADGKPQRAQKNNSKASLFGKIRSRLGWTPESNSNNQMSY